MVGRSKPSTPATSPSAQRAAPAQLDSSMMIEDLDKHPRPPVDRIPAPVKAARQRLVLCRLMIDVMRSVHGAYAPADQPFGSRLETFFIGLCVALGGLEQRPFSVSKIAAYMRVPRTTVMRRLDQLQGWGLIARR